MQLQESLAQARIALAGDSNDAEHDALFALVNALKATTAELDETEEAKRGELIAEVLQCDRDREYHDRYQTTWGTKTGLGLFRVVKRIVEDGE